MTTTPTLLGAICYYSATGNTKLASEYIARHAGADFELIDVIRDGDSIDVERYDVVGLAAPTDFGGMPQRFEQFLADLPEQGGKPAFVMNTYGFASGRTLLDLDERATSRGFTVVAAHSLRMPENYPPMISIGLGFPLRPKAKDVRTFDKFIGDVSGVFDAIASGETVAAQTVRLGMLGGLSGSRPRTTARDDMGEKSVDVSRCTECGRCARRCPYGAIEMSPKPVFDTSRCMGCWRCYNQCPERAISTRRFHARPTYEGPSPHARHMLGAE